MADPADVAEKLLRLADLVADGLLERDEFDRLKADLLASSVPVAPDGPDAPLPPPDVPPPSTELERIAEELRDTLNRMPDSAVASTIANSRWAYLVKFPTDPSSFTRRVELVDGAETVVMMRSRHDDRWEITGRRFADGQVPPPAPTQRRSGPPPV